MSEQNNNIIAVKNISKVYVMGQEKVHALRDVSLDIRRGEYLSIMGPSGSGKSTFFNMVGGLDTPSTGEVFVEGHKLADLNSPQLAWFRCHKIGFIFQSFNLIPTMTALENVAIARLFYGRQPGLARDEAAEILEKVGLGHRLDHLPSEVSGGQQQRIAIARALVNEPAIVLADEPTGNLDLHTGEEIINLLNQMKESLGITIITATHDMKMLSASDTVVWIKDGSIERVAHQGEFEVHLPGDADPKQFDQMMERLDRMGVNATISTPQDTELMYLQKQAYVLKADKSAPYKKVMQDLDRRSASKEERIARLRGFWEKKLGVPDLTKTSGYDPVGEHQLQWNDPRKHAGYRHQMRFDISDDDLEREMAGYGLYHRLTDDQNLPKFVDEVLGSNSAMASTVEKMRVGIKPGGMSPQEDMNTGGASYFFTRIRKLPGQRGGSRTPGLYFKKRMLRRMDAITYSGDKYGRVTADTVRKNRRSNIEDWKKIASRGGNDETIFKYSVTLFDNIEVVAVSNPSERTKVIQAFRKHGITRLPDGRKLEEVVVTR